MVFPCLRVDLIIFKRIKDGRRLCSLQENFFVTLLHNDFYLIFFCARQFLSNFMMMLILLIYNQIYIGLRTK